MEAYDEFGLDDICFESHVPQKSIMPKAYFKSIKELYFDGIPIDSANYSMTRVKGSQYLMQTHKDHYFVDINTLKAERLELYIFGFTKCFIDGKYMLVVNIAEPMTIYRYQRVIGQIEFHPKFEVCKNGKSIYGRYTKQAGQTVYALNKHACLYRIEWQDVKAGKYCLALVMTNVENFYAHKTFGLTTISVYGNLFLDSGIKVSLWQKVDSTVKWKIVTCIAKFWVVSGDLEFDGQAIMASISRKGDIRSTFKHMLTSNGYNNYKGNEYGGIYALQKVYARGMQGIMMVIERDGCCHLIPVYYGRLSILQSIDSIVPASEYYSDGQFNIVTSVSATHTRGEFMIGGFYWTKRITVKLE